MTSIQTNVGELKQHLPHLKDVTDDGWILQWGGTDSGHDSDDERPVFELLCPSAPINTLSTLDQRLSEAYEKARILFAAQN